MAKVTLNPVLEAIRGSFLDEGQFEGWAEPSQRGARRLAGLDLNKARNRTVIAAVTGLATQPEGFTLTQLAEAVRGRMGLEEGQYPARRAAYDLAKRVEAAPPFCVRGDSQALKSSNTRTN